MLCSYWTTSRTSHCKKDAMLQTSSLRCVSNTIISSVLMDVGVVFINVMITGWLCSDFSPNVMQLEVGQISIGICSLSTIFFSSSLWMIFQTSIYQTECMSKSRRMGFKNVSNVMEWAHILRHANTRTCQNPIIRDFSRVDYKRDSVESEKVEAGFEVGKGGRLDMKERGRGTVGFPLRSTPTTCDSWACL